MQFTEMLLKHVNEGQIQEISEKAGLGVSDVTNLLQESVPLLMGKVMANVQNPGLLSKLTDYLDKDDDGQILDDLLETLGLTGDTAQGEGGFQSLLSEKTGISLESVTKLIPLAVPVLMKSFRESTASGSDGGLNIGALLGGLSGGQAGQGTSSPLDMLTGLLDQDGDGQALDDIGAMASSLFGGNK